MIVSRQKLIKIMTMVVWPFFLNCNQLIIEDDDVCIHAEVNLMVRGDFTYELVFSGMIQSNHFLSKSIIDIVSA